MGDLGQFQIFLDNPHGVYYSGQTVAGHVEIQLNAPKRLRGIRINIKGEALVRWSERRTATHNHERRTTHTTYTATEKYFSLENYLLGGPGQDLTLSVEKHIFPFSAVLPTGLPSSFEGQYGYVRYTIKVTMDRPWKFDHEAKAIFTIIQHLDLNAELSVKEPVQLSAEKFLCCLWCRSGPIVVTLTLPVTGYVPGQEIPMDVNVDNASNKYVDVIAHLLQTVIFHASRKSCQTVIKLCEMNIGSVTRHGSGSWLGRLMIPPVPPSFLRNCSIIDINYSLVVKACISGLHKNLTMQAPIVVGTVPLVMYQPSSSNPLPPQYSEREIKYSAWGAEPSAPMDTSNYPETSPPTYEECMHGRKDTRDEDDSEYTRGNLEFAPRYPTYQFQSEVKNDINKKMSRKHKSNELLSDHGDMNDLQKVNITESKTLIGSGPCHYGQSPLKLLLQLRPSGVVLVRTQLEEELQNSNS